MSTKLLCPPNYKVIALNRASRGGGVCLIYDETYSVNIMESCCLDYMEFLVLHITKGAMSLILFVVYRIPGTNNQLFLDKFSDLIASHTTEMRNILVVGDFNIGINKNDSSSKKLLSVLHEFDLSNFSHIATHRSGNILDLVISTMEIGVIQVIDIKISDHYLLD